MRKGAALYVCRRRRLGSARGDGRRVASRPRGTCGLFRHAGAAQCEFAQSHPTLVAAAPAEALKIFDINLRLDLYSREVIEASLRLSNVLKLNDEELAVLTAMFSLHGDVRRRIERLVHIFDSRSWL